MFALLSAKSLCAYCDNIIDLSKTSDYDGVNISANTGYCFRFVTPHGVFMMNKIGLATATSYYANSYSSDLNAYYFDAQMYNSYQTVSAPRAVSFGGSYGLVYVYSSVATTIFYSYQIANASCSQVTLTSKTSQFITLPTNSTTSIASNKTYCFMYAAYGDQTAEIERFSSSEGDEMYITYGNNEISSIPNGTRSYNLTYPLQIVYTSNNNGSDPRYSINVSSSDNNYDVVVYGVFTDMVYVAHINYNVSSGFNYNFLAKPLIIAAIAIGGIFGIFIIYGIFWYFKHRITTVTTTDYTSGNSAPASQLNASLCSPAPQQQQPAVVMTSLPFTQYPQYPAPQPVQYVVGPQQYAVLPPMTTYTVAPPQTYAVGPLPPYNSA